MALTPSTNYLPNKLLHSHFRNPIPNSSPFLHHKTLKHHKVSISAISNDRNPPPSSLSAPNPPRSFHLAVSTILFVVFSSGRVSAADSGKVPDLPPAVFHQERIDGGDVNSVDKESAVLEEDIEDEELKAALEIWKAKTFALTCPLRIVALRGSVPPSWIKDFVVLQGRRLKLCSEVRGSLSDIFSDLCSTISTGNIEPKSAMAADIISIGDSWLDFGISKGVIEPILGVEGLDWFKCLSEKWKVYLRRNINGGLDSSGKFWAVPYRWGSMVIAYKTNIFQKHNMAPIEDWSDLWRPELAGRISMVDSPREVVGAVLKYMGASYNTKDIESEVDGGKEAVVQNLALLQRQVRLFDSVHYLKAFAVRDTWIAVGWSSDILPAAKRMSNVAVVVPKSGASLWADLWAIPAASKFSTDRIGGRVRGPSPLIHQWIEFCLQAARSFPFKQEVIPGASPFALEGPPAEEPPELTKGKPKLVTNLVAGVPPPDVLAKCEFLEPLSESSIKDYQWLISNMQKPSRGFISNLQNYLSSIIQYSALNPQSNGNLKKARFSQDGRE